MYYLTLVSVFVDTWVEPRVVSFGTPRLFARCSSCFGDMCYLSRTTYFVDSRVAPGKVSLGTPLLLARADMFLWACASSWGQQHKLRRHESSTFASCR